MSNPTSVIDFTDDLAGFLARANQFGETNQSLIQPKRNKSPGDGTASPGFPATESTSKSVAQWPNMVDDFQLKWADWTGGANTVGFAGSIQKFTLGVSLGLATARGGVGTPEGVVTAGVGSIFLRTDGGAGTTLYTKETGAGNTGWVAVGGGGGGGGGRVQTVVNQDMSTHTSALLAFDIPMVSGEDTLLAAHWDSPATYSELPSIPGESLLVGDKATIVTSSTNWFMNVNGDGVDLIKVGGGLPAVQQVQVAASPGRHTFMVVENPLGGALIWRSLAG